MKESNIVLFKTSDGAFSMPVRFGADSAWLTQAQMSQLFGKEQSVISRHIKNAINEGEIDISTGAGRRTGSSPRSQAFSRSFGSYG